MSAIAATGSPSSYSAVAQLLANSLPSASAGTSQAGQSSASDSLNLSDHAKSVLARAKNEQVAADQLQTFLQSARNPNGASNNAAPSQASDDAGAQIFDQLKGQTQSHQGNAAFVTLNDFISADVLALIAANKGSDGTVGAFSQTLHDVVGAAPSTPQEVAAWYQSADAQMLASEAQVSPDDAGLAEALASHAVTFLNGSDIPDLNFHNTISIQGGEGGNSAGDIYTYNHNAAIFSDPATSYKVLYDGTVIAWKTPPSIAATTSN